MKSTKEIRAVYDNDTIRVYQAFSDMIADEALASGHFGEHFKLSRMSWIKPSFLWMMYRSGWGTKEGQERILAINIKRYAFDYIVKNSVLSTWNKELYSTESEWREILKVSEIRCQWDPERDVNGHGYSKTIQLGLRGEALQKYVNEWIVSIEDITGYVRDLDKMRKSGEDITSMLPCERIYIPFE